MKDYHTPHAIAEPHYHMRERRDLYFREAATYFLAAFYGQHELEEDVIFRKVFFAIARDRQRLHTHRATPTHR